jgi:hypothetical protein
MLIFLDRCLSCMDLLVNGPDFGGVLEVRPEIQAIVDHPQEVFYACLSLLKHLFYNQNFFLELSFLSALTLFLNL